MGKTFRRLALAAFLSFVVYPLSYAPIDRAFHGVHYVSIEDSRTRMTVYRPVTLLIDHGPVAEPLLRWSRIFGMESLHRTDRNVRRFGHPWVGMTLDIF